MASETVTLYGVEYSTKEAADLAWAWLNKYQGRFIEPESGEIVDEENGCGGWCDVDREGHPLVGYDEMGMWWGTERAVWVLSQQTYTVEVWGYCGADEYIGHFMGTMEEAREYCECHSVKVTLVQKGGM